MHESVDSTAMPAAQAVELVTSTTDSSTQDLSIPIPMAQPAETDLHGPENDS